MTEKTDIAALREECAQWVKDNFGDLIDTRMAENGDGNDYTAWDMVVLWRAWCHLSGQLEAERQRGDYRQQVIDQRNAECDRLIAELAALRGKQEPVAWTDAEELRDVEKHGCGYLFKIDQANPYTDPRRQIMLYRCQPKPVVVLPDQLDFDCELENSEGDKEEGWLRGRVAGFNEAIKQCDSLMRAAGIVVNDCLLSQQEGKTV